MRRKKRSGATEKIAGDVYGVLTELKKHLEEMEDALTSKQLIPAKGKKSERLKHNLCMCFNYVNSQRN